MPPWRYMDNFGADIYALVSEDKEFKAKSLQMLPLVGTTLYSRSSAGQQGFANQERKEILEKVKENRESRKGAYAGDLSKMIREYNKKVSRDKRITNDTIMRAYRGRD